MLRTLTLGGTKRPTGLRVPCLQWVAPSAKGRAQAVDLETCGENLREQNMETLIFRVRFVSKWCALLIVFFWAPVSIPPPQVVTGASACLQLVC